MSGSGLPHLRQDGLGRLRPPRGLILIPIILAYTAYAYWVFRGKVGDDGYH